MSKFIVKNLTPDQVSSVAGVPGVTVRGCDVIVPAKSRAAVERMLASGPGVSFASSLAKMYTPTDADRAKIAGLIGQELADQVAIFQVEAANTRIDYQRDRFTRDLLMICAMQANANPGVSVLFDHDSEYIIGRVFEGKVVDIADGVSALMVKLYILPGTLMPNDTGLTVEAAVKGGILQYTSIGVSAPTISWEEGPDEYYRVIGVENPNDVVYIEQSLVYRGAQRGAAVKSVDQKKICTFEPFNPTKMDIKIKEFTLTVDGDTVKGVEIIEKSFNDMQAAVDAAKAENDRLTAELKALKEPRVSAVIALEKSLGLVDDAGIESRTNELMAKSIGDIDALNVKLAALVKDPMRKVGESPKTEKSIFI